MARPEPDEVMLYGRLDSQMTEEELRHALRWVMRRYLENMSTVKGLYLPPRRR